MQVATVGQRQPQAGIGALGAYGGQAKAHVGTHPAQGVREDLTGEGGFRREQ